MERWKPRWSDIKKQISALEQAELVRLVRSLYELGKSNRDFLRARFAKADDGLHPYREVIDRCLYPDVNRSWSFQVAEAKRAISHYTKAVPEDRKGAADLMTYFVECGTRFCLDYQYLDDDPLFLALLRMFDRAVRAVLELPETDRDDFRQRLREIVISSSEMTWGYYEELSDQYDNAFPAKDEGAHT